MKTVNELLRYGTILQDIQVQDITGNYIRYRLIELDDIIYSLHMENNDVLELKEVSTI